MRNDTHTYEQSISYSQYNIAQRTWFSKRSFFFENILTISDSTTGKYENYIVQPNEIKKEAYRRVQKKKKLK